MADFSFKKQLSSTVASANISNIIGGESSFVYNYFRAKFPDNFFKDTFISQQLNSFKFKTTVPHQRLPLLAMGSTFEIEESTLGPISRQYTTQYTVFNKDKDVYYRTIFADEDNNIFIYSVDNRAVVKHNFAIKLQTEMQAWNVVNYLNQNFETNGRVYLNAIRLPAVLPNNFIHNICKNFGWDIESTDPDTARAAREELRTYLIKHGLGGITEQVNPQTGNINYMYDYTANILLTYPDNANHESNITDLITKNAIVRYQIASEFWFPGSFVIDFNHNFDYDHKLDDAGLNNLTTKFTIVVDKEVIPKTLDNGYQYIRQARYTPDVNNEIDEIDIDSFFDEGIMNIVKNAQKYKIDCNKILAFVIFKNNIPLDPEKYSIDYDTLKITVNHPEPNSNFTLVLYGDLEKLNILNHYIVTHNMKEISKLDIFHDYDFVDNSDKNIT